MADSHRVYAVIRSIGERTAERCERIVSVQCPYAVISVAPFVDAVRESLRLGVQSGAEWLLTVDADMLLSPDVVRQCEAVAAILPPDVAQFQVQTLDYLLGAVRPAGPRMYRVSRIPEFLSVLKDCVRPEGAMTRIVERFQPVEMLVGRHDFEQWRRDYHRKGAQHRAKNGHSARWRKRALYWKSSADLDMQAAWQGWIGEPLTIPEKGPLC